MNPLLLLSTNLGSLKKNYSEMGVYPLSKAIKNDHWRHRQPVGQKRKIDARLVSTTQVAEVLYLGNVPYKSNLFGCDLPGSGREDLRGRRSRKADYWLVLLNGKATGPEQLKS